MKCHIWTLDKKTFTDISILWWPWLNFMYVFNEEKWSVRNIAGNLWGLATCCTVAQLSDIGPQKCYKMIAEIFLGIPVCTIFIKFIQVLKPVNLLLSHRLCATLTYDLIPDYNPIMIKTHKIIDNCCFVWEFCLGLTKALGIQLWFDTFKFLFFPWQNIMYFNAIIMHKMIPERGIECTNHSVKVSQSVRHLYNDNHVASVIYWSWLSVESGCFEQLRRVEHY